MNRARVRLFLLLGLVVARVAFAGPVPSAKPNILLVTLDTTRADRLGCYGHDTALTPNLDALAARGVLFEDAFASAPMTLPSHATLFTGLEPPEHGVHVNGGQALPASVPTVAERLRAGGWTTGAFVAAFVVDQKFGLARGFEVYDDDLSAAYPATLPEPLSVYRAGDHVVDSALLWLGRVAGGPRPFFAWVHLYDAHEPDHAHPSLRGTRYAGVASYDAEVAFDDQQVGRLVSFLERHGLLEYTAIVVVGDHGEGFGEHGERGHGYRLSAEALHVPLIVSAPAMKPLARRVRTVVPLVDVAPTLLDVAGLAPVGRGRSLRPALTGGVVGSQSSYAETDLPFTAYDWSPQRALTTERWRYVRSPRVELYDRVRDPLEAHDVAGEQPAAVAECEAALAAVEAGMRRVDAAPVDGAGRERLEALGYVVPSAAAHSVGVRADLPDVKDMLPVRAGHKALAADVVAGRVDVEGQIVRVLELVRRSPGTATFHGQLGALLLSAGKVEESLAEVGVALKIRPGVPEVMATRAEGLRRVGEGGGGVTGHAR